MLSGAHLIGCILSWLGARAGIGVPGGLGRKPEVEQCKVRNVGRNSPRLSGLCFPVSDGSRCLNWDSLFNSSGMQCPVSQLQW